MPEAIMPKSAEDERVFEGYRRWGYLAANLDPLGFLTPIVHPELIVNGEAATAARKFYCGTIGAEFVHIDDTERRRWIAERLECDAPQPDRGYILERLIRAELFEQVLQARYLGSKRFSLEGVTAVIPLLDQVLSAASAAGAEQVVLGMSHRGRLNVMAHIAGSARRIFLRASRMWTRAACWAAATSSITSARRGNTALAKGANSAFTWLQIQAISKRSILWSWGARAPSKRARELPAE